MEVNETIKGILKDNKQALADNDLESLYDDMDRRVSRAFILPGIVGDVTNVLDQCGIDIIRECNKLGYIPKYFLYNNHYLGSMIGKGDRLYGGRDALILPPNIKEIRSQAFCLATTPNIIDIRNVKDIGEWAFVESDIETLILGPTGPIGEDAFMDTKLKKVYLPKVLLNNDKYVESLFFNSGVDIYKIDLIGY